MWQQEECGYSSFFFSGLQAISTASHRSRPSSMIAGPSSASPPDSPLRSTTLYHTKTGHSRTSSVPQNPYSPTHVHIDTEFYRLGRPTRQFNSSHPTINPKLRRSSPAHSYHDRPLPRTPMPSPYPRDSDGDVDTDLPLNDFSSFLSFNISPTESSVSLVSKRERRASIQTVPLPPKQSRENRRRSAVTIDLPPIDYESWSSEDGRGHEYQDSFASMVDDGLGDWRQREDFPPDGHSFLITSY